MSARLGALFAAALLLLALPVLALPALGKTLVICSDGDPEALDPQTVHTLTGIAATEPNFEGLVTFGDDGTILPALADAWTISPDGLAYTFHLRDGVRFHGNARFVPSRDFDADDVLFSIERQWKGSNPFHAIGGHAFTYFDDMEISKLLAGVDRIDGSTVRFRLNHPEAPFLADLAMPFAKVLSAEYAAAMLRAGAPEQFDEEPIGTGPFAFRSYQKGVAIQFGAFDGYWGRRAKIDTLAFSIAPSASVRLNKLEVGECQVMPFPPPSALDRIAGDPQLTLLRQEALNVGYMTMSASRPPFDDVRVRRAVNMAIDKGVIVRAIFGGLGREAKNPLPPGLWSYDDSIAPYPHDVAAAQRLMAESGHGEGFDADMWYMPVARPYSPDGRRMAEMVADDLSRIGIRAHLRTVPWADYVDRLLGGVSGMAFIGETSDNGDPDNFLGSLLACHDGVPFDSDIARWCDPTYDALVAEAVASSDHARRVELYRRAQVIAHDEAPWVPIAHSVVLTAIRREVRGFELTPFGRFRLGDVDIADP